MQATDKKTPRDAAIADRRSFLKLAGASAVTGATAAVTAAPAAAAEAVGPKTGLYRETEHIRRYYELAR